MIFPSFIEPNPKILVLGTSSITRGQANSVSCGQKLSRGYWSYIFFKKSPFWHFHLFSMVLTKDVSKFFLQHNFFWSSISISNDSSFWKINKNDYCVVLNLYQSFFYSHKPFFCHCYYTYDSSHPVISLEIMIIIMWSFVNIITHVILLVKYILIRVSIVE